MTIAGFHRHAIKKQKSKPLYCIERLNGLNTFKEHNQSTSTWFGRTEQHDSGHVTLNKFPGPHNVQNIKSRIWDMKLDARYSGK